jgi:hypothetical protein
VLVLGRDGIDALDLATGAWTTLPSPHPGAGWTSTRVVTLGTTLLFASTQTSAVELYDSTTGTWTQSKAPTEPRSGVAVAVVGPEVVFAGGSSGNPSQPSTTADIYDTRTGAWRTAALAEPREKLEVAEVGTTAVFAGGRGPRSADLADVYDSATGTWTTQPLSVPRTDLAIATADSRVLLAGGTANKMRSDRVDIFETAAPAPGGSQE